MKIPVSWVKDFVDIKVEAEQLADDLTSIGLACDGIEKFGNEAVLDLDITTNRVDAMNMYGVAREAATFYGLPLKPLDLSFPESGGDPNPAKIAAGNEWRCGQSLVHAESIMQRAIVPPTVLGGIGKLALKIAGAQHLPLPVLDSFELRVFGPCHGFPPQFTVIWCVPTFTSQVAPRHTFPHCFCPPSASRSSEAM